MMFPSIVNVNLSNSFFKRFPVFLSHMPHEWQTDFASSRLMFNSAGSLTREASSLVESLSSHLPVVSMQARSRDLSALSQSEDPLTSYS